MKCPHCGKDIPDDYGEEEEKSLTVLTRINKLPWLDNG